MKYSIRDLLWLTIVAGLVVGWYAERRSSRLLGVELEKVSGVNESMKRYLRVWGVDVTAHETGVVFEDKAKNDRTRDRMLKMLHEEMSDTLMRSELEEMKRLIRGEESDTANK